MNIENKPLEQGTKNITLSLIIAWGFGGLCLIGGLVYLFQKPMLGIVYFLISFITLPPLYKIVSSKLHINLSKSLRVISVIVLLSIAGALFGSDMSEEVISPAGEVQKVVDKEESNKTESYQEVFTFSGTGTKKSEPFTITGSRFKIAYDCKGDYCGAFVYELNSKIPQAVMNNTGTIKDETIIYGSGEYYIDTNVMGSFTMTVYDYK